MEGTNEATANRKKPNAPWWIKLFVLFHVICITSWSIPNASPAQLSGQLNPPTFAAGDWVRVWNNRYVKKQPPLQAYLFVTGFWQYWDMFAPNPAHTDFYCDADVIFKDGTHKTYQYPRVFELPIPSKYVQERYRKYFERVHEDKNSYLWPQFAQHIAFVNDNPANPPVKVRLNRHWLEIAPPGKPQDTAYSSYMFFELSVDQRALARMRAGKA